MPAMKVSGDSEGEMSGAESERSGHSSRGGDRDSSAEEADEPDSDDSSEMDESECERRRIECMENLADLERQFAVLREQLYKEKVTQVEWQLTEVRGGRSIDYLGPLRTLQENMRQRIEVAAVLKQLRIDNVKNKYEAEEMAAMQNFNSEKRMAWERIREDLLEKIRRLEEDRQNVELSWSEWGKSSAATGTGNTTVGGGSGLRGRGRRKAVTISGPYIVYMLSDQEIMEDWTTIKKALKRTCT